MDEAGRSQQTPPGGAMDPACFVRGEKRGNRRCARPAPGEGLMNPPLPRAGSRSPAAWLLVEERTAGRRGNGSDS